MHTCLDGTSQPHRQAGTVLLVEDEVLIRIQLADELRDQGYTVIEAADGNEALSVLRSSARVDILVTDFRMPSRDPGWHRAGPTGSLEYPAVSVVMTSAQMPDAHVSQILDGFFPKPCDVTKLIAHLAGLGHREEAHCAVRYRWLSLKPASSVVQETVLVVEDEVLVRMVVADYLRSCGYKVIEAASADEALVVLQRADIVVDVVFSDIEMPGTMDGFALSAWVRNNRPGLDVILVGSVQRAAKAASDLCDSGPLPKPYEPQIVVDRIRRLMAARATSNKD